MSNDLYVNGHKAEPRPYLEPLEPLSDEQYAALSNDEIKTRYLHVIESQISRAAYFSKKVKSPSEYLADELEKFSSIAGSQLGVESQDTKNREIELARQVVRFESLVSTGLKRLVSFSVTPGTFECIGDPSLEELLDYWRDNLGGLNALPGFVKQGSGLKLFEETFVRDLLRDGDLVISEVWQNVDVPITNVTAGGKRSVKVKKFNLPTRLSIHDVSTLNINTVTSLYNREVITVKVPDELKQLVKKSSKLEPHEAETVKQLAPHVIQQIKAGKDEVSLTDPNGGESFVTHIKLHGDDYAPWGVSFFAPCFEPVSRKYKLRALDESMISGLINRLTIIKAGVIDLESGSTTITPQRLRNLEQLISQPKHNELIIWPGNDISVEDIGPDGKILEVENRYEHVDRDILASLGIPRVLIDGRADVSGERTVYASFLGLREFIDQDIRNNRLIPYIQGLITRIAQKNNFKGEYPKYQMGEVNLADPELQLNRSKYLYDRGLQAERSAVTNNGGNWKIELERRRFESENGIVKNFDLPPLAFNAPQDRGNSGDKPDTEKISEPDKVDDSKSGASAYLVDKQYALDIRDTYNEQSALIIRRMETGEFSEASVKAALIVMFGLLKKNSRAYVESLYADLADDYFDASMLSTVTSWTDEQFDNWHKSVLSKVVDAFRASDDKAVVIAIITGILSQSLANRASKYEMAIPSKTERAALISQSIASGMAYGTWEATLDERTCEYCAAMHGVTMPIDRFVELYPSHPGCRCDLIEHSELPDGAVTDVPEKKHDDWSSVAGLSKSTGA